MVGNKHLFDTYHQEYTNGLENPNRNTLLDLYKNSTNTNANANQNCVASSSSGIGL